MVEMGVEATTREAIKPSSPTPPHLRTFKLSFLDQSSPLMYFPFVFFYPATGDQIPVEKKIAQLKDSLSKALTLFYPIAGRIKDATTIDCNDEGALYVEARVSCSLSECISPPKIELLDNFLPCEIICKEPPKELAQIAVKANIFSCGGIALGMCFFHKLIDAATFTAFVKAWATIARENCDKEVNVNNTAATIFPPNEEFSPAMAATGELASMAKEAQGRIQRFVFNASSLSTLKAKARSEQVPNPSRSGAVSGLIWKCALKAFRETSSEFQRPSLLTFSLNLRPRLKPPLPQHTVGNIILTKTTCYDPTSETISDELPRLVSLIRKTVDKVDLDYLKKLQGTEGYKEIHKSLEEEQGMYSDSRKPIIYGVASMCTMGFYEADFGWGRPIWVALGPVVKTLLKNFILQKETSSGDGIEAWVVLDKQEMEIFESDPELLTYATLNPDISS
ncbi:stemmadenine O-acetyltransferase-like [Tripterygium wilfordii]|uniref:stemmadenine O-acetyltransferase-like n=1 Tax=Tripterygium wilfordii TaxID=458696 RepID=UPI0018F7E6E0|nr:stemmadenine O-acetyltransferase-like [Tripterygium wilfordii]